MKPAQAPMAATATVWTIGHSTRPLDEFLGLLAGHRIEAIADVRRFPGSRKHPQFGQEALAAALAARSVAYHWMPALGGRRRAAPDSKNTVWRNASFRAYADYMATAEFAQALAGLLTVTQAARTALMCAEALWWRCHRSLIADALCVRGIEVVHIMGGDHGVVHPMTSAARIVGGVLTYGAAEPD